MPFLPDPCVPGVWLMGPSLFNSLTPTPCWNFSDVTLADEDTNSVLADDANTMHADRSISSNTLSSRLTRRCTMCGRRSPAWSVVPLAVWCKQVGVQSTLPWYFLPLNREWDFIAILISQTYDIIMLHRIQNDYFSWFEKLNTVTSRSFLLLLCLLCFQVKTRHLHLLQRSTLQQK